MKPLRSRDTGNATVVAILVVTVALPAAGIPLSLINAADARTRAAAAADLIALNGCENASDLNPYRDTSVVECTDDGIAVHVETRTRISLPRVLGLSLFVHARAHAVHEM